MSFATKPHKFLNEVNDSAGSFRQGEDELQAVIFVLPGRDHPAMELHGVLDNGQSQTRTSILAGPPLADPVKAVEKTGQMHIVHPATGIVIVEMVQTSILVIHLDMNYDPFAGIMQRVLYQVPEQGV